MFQTRRFSPLTLVFPALLSVSCTTSGVSGGGGAVGVVAIASGGTVGTSCPGEDSIACAPGFGEKVRCKGGSWISDGKCEAGSVCAETKNGVAVTSTACGYPTFSDSALALACMKTAQCDLDSSWPICAGQGMVSQKLKNNIAAFGGVYQVKSIADDVLSSATLSCLKTAMTCAAVGQCVSGALGPCKPGEVAGCQGSVGWECGSDGVRFSVDCASLGLQCVPFGKDALCAAPATGCQPGMSGVLCKGDDSNVCISQGGVSVGFVMHCGAAGMTCGPASKADDDLDACVPKTSVPCDSATFVERCEGNKRIRCKNNVVVTHDCALLGDVCEMHADGDLGTYASCVSSSKECDGPAKCAGDTVTFCSKGNRYSLDCAKFGLKCGYSETAYDDVCLIP